MNRTAKAVAAIVVALALAGCTGSAADERDTETITLTQDALANSVTQGGREMYAGAAGAGGPEQSVQIELPLDRNGLTISGLCSGGEGTALVRLNKQGPFELPCSKDGEEQEITRSLPLQGIRLLITVQGAPANVTWAIAAASSP
ncbi:hypothetical protein [Arthrobacter sp.]|uniref:hypothetical protein n=1 Tax=Arthrobacter sp. TaxID=1667 RepID=UPI00289838E8|nr:hypothetical protein [Arthrobacter sp.]